MRQTGGTDNGMVSHSAAPVLCLVQLVCRANTRTIRARVTPATALPADEARPLWRAALAEAHLCSGVVEKFEPPSEVSYFDQTATI